MDALALVNVYGLSVFTVSTDSGSGRFVHVSLAVLFAMQACAALLRLRV